MSDTGNPTGFTSIDGKQTVGGTDQADGVKYGSVDDVIDSRGAPPPYSAVCDQNDVDVGSVDPGWAGKGDLPTPVIGYQPNGEISESSSMPLTGMYVRSEEEERRRRENNYTADGIYVTNNEAELCCWICAWCRLVTLYIPDRSLYKQPLPRSYDKLKNVIALAVIL